MEPSPSANTKRIAWLASGFFLLWSGLAVLAAVRGYEGLRALFSTLCHQIPERSYSLAGEPFGLCVRCLWIYLGLAAGHLFFAHFRVGERKALRLLYPAIGLMLADVALETLGAYDNWKLTRAITGGLFGFSCSWFTLCGLNQLFFNRKTQSVIYESN